MRTIVTLIHALGAPLATISRLIAIVRGHRAIGLSLLDSFRLTMAGVSPVWGGTDTSFATGAAETVKKWATRIWYELPKEIYWARFFGTGPMSIIEVKTELEGKPGDQITFTLLRKLTGAGVTGDSTLETNEEAMSHLSDTVVIDQVRNAVRLSGRMSERRTAFNQRDSARNVLKTWLAENIDASVFTQFATSPTITVFGGSASSTATIDATSKITPGLIDKLVGKAKKTLPKIHPTRFMNKDLYVFVMHTDVGFDLRQDGTWTQNQREAWDRGADNSGIFTGRLGVHNMVVLHEHEMVPTSTTFGAGGTEPGATNMFLGRQAGVFAWGSKPQWWEKEFDYGNKIGFAVGAIFKFKKAVFGSVDNGYLQATTYRSNL